MRPRPSSRRRARLGLVGALAVALPAGLFARDYAYVRWPPGRIWFPPDATADVAFVPSGDPGDRTRRAVELLKAGRVEALVFSGAGHGGDNAHLMAKWAVDWGAPPDRVFVEPNATSTLENVRLALPLLRRLGARTVVTVTHRSHAPRVAWLFQREAPARLKVWTEPAVTSGRPPSWHREAAAMLAARLECLIRNQGD